MKFNIYILLACFFCLNVSVNHAQNQSRAVFTPTTEEYSKCASHEYLQQMQAKNPALYSDDAIETWIKRKIEEDKANGIEQRATYRIPVVVHVIHEGQAVGVQRNIPAAQVLSQIRVLNEDYNRTNPDASNTRAIFLDVAGSLDIEFVPAVVDPDGNLMAEPGIDRVNGQAEFGIVSWSGPGGNTDAILKPGTIWDPTRYMNMWTVLFSSSGLLGYAQFPQINLPGNQSNTNASTDGVVMNFRAFGSNYDENGDLVNNFNLINLGEKGRTTTHEVGHWLGLRHIWGDTDCTGDDFVNDTPLQGNDSPFSANCNFNLNTCTTANDLPDQLENYMDYSGDLCMNMFTAGQATRMETVLTNAPRRASLLTSTVWQDPDNSILASFVVNNNGGCGPITVSFSDGSTAGSNVDAINSWIWNFDKNELGGVSQTSFSGQNPPAVTFSNPGTYTIELTISNGTLSSTFTQQVTVTSASSAGTFDHLNGGSLFNELASAHGGTSGYVGGHNSFDDIAKAEYFAEGAPGLILDYVDFNFAIATAPNGRMLTCAIWADQGGAPGNMITSTTIPISSITTNSLTRVDFGDVELTGPFYAGIVLNLTNGSNVALYTNGNDIVGPTDPATAWEQFGDNSWHNFSEPDISWGFDVALAVYATIKCPEVVATLPVAAFDADDLSVCTGVPVQFTDQSTGVPTSWSWNFGDGSPLSNVQNPTHTFTTGGSKSVTLTVTNSEGSDDTTVIINVQQAPTGFQGNASTSAICNGENVSLSMGGTFGAAYSWEVNGNNIANGSSTTVSPTATTTYTAVCDNGVCRVTDDVTVTVTTIPTPSITQNGFTLTASGTGVFQWFLNGMLIPDESTSTLIAEENGNYTVNVTLGGCTSALSAAATVANTAVIDKTLDAAITVYPNPVKDLLNIELVGNIGQLSLELIDVTGRVLVSETSIVAATTIDMSSLSSGTYLVKFIDANGKLAVKQIVKQ